MAYPPRFFVEDQWYHVTSKGQRGEPLFFSPEDRIRYPALLQDELRRRGGFLGSVCLMTNHVHLLVQMKETPLDRIFQPTHMKYAQYFNEKRDTDGHVFQSRPDMRIVLDEEYLFSLTGYIHRNPVEAGITESAVEYEWSSWPMFYGRCPDWLDEEVWKDPPVFDEEDRSEQFEKCLGEEVGDEFSDVYVGSESEWENFEKRQEGREGGKYKERRGRRPREEIVETVCEDSTFTTEGLKGPSQEEDVSEVRREAMALMYEEGWGPTNIGRFFNRSPSAVVHAYQKWKEE